jgi:hypothetical protein
MGVCVDGNIDRQYCCRAESFLLQSVQTWPGAHPSSSTVVTETPSLKGRLAGASVSSTACNADINLLKPSGFFTYHQV